MTNNTHIDADLLALQQSRMLIKNAKQALPKMMALSPDKAWEVAEKVAYAAASKAEFYAEWAVKETGMGNVTDKVTKNQIASMQLLENYRSHCLGGMRAAASGNIIEVARPAGVVVALVASTSPIATLYFKVLIALMTRNVVILSPHPISKACTQHAAAYLHQVALDAGAPENCIQIQQELSLPATLKLMQDPDTNLIIATGGNPMVRSAYASGRPALGVGAGNVPAIVDSGLNYNHVAEQIITSKNFDHGTPCNAESMVIAVTSIAAQLKQAMKAHKAHFCNTAEQQLLSEFAYPKGNINPAIVGKPAQWIASKSGFNVPKNCAALVVEIDRIGAQTEPFSREKLSPILAFHTANNQDHAIALARQVLEVSGKGHTASVHTSDEVYATQVGIELDVNRLIVNLGSLNSSGMPEVGLNPTFTLGTGFGSGSSIAENLGPQHLIQWKQIAFPLVGTMQVKPAAIAPHQANASQTELMHQLKQLVRDELANV